MKAGIYVRVSTTVQSIHGTGLQRQTERCQAKAKELGAQVIVIWADQASGAKYMSREGLQAMLAAVESGAVDTVIVESVDRLGRDVEHLNITKRRIEKAGGRLVFCDWDTPEFASLMASVKSTMQECARPN